uniref:Uncharacterized protein n=1 Tax=Trichuris muris TaxID=70415 RepID=A0A5S6R2D9_TRIMR
MCEKNGNMEVNSPTTGASSSHDSSPKPANVNVSEARKRFDELTSSIDSVLASTEYVQGLYSKLFEDQQVTGAPSASNRFSVPPRRYDDINMLQNAIEALNDWIAEAEKVKALDNKSEALDLWSFFDNLLCSFCQMRMSIHDYLAHLPSCVSPVMKVVQPRERKTFEAVLCDHVDSLSGVQCEQFRSVCREHRHINFPTRVDGDRLEMVSVSGTSRTSRSWTLSFCRQFPVLTDARGNVHGTSYSIVTTPCFCTADLRIQVFSEGQDSDSIPERWLQSLWSTPKSTYYGRISLVDLQQWRGGFSRTGSRPVGSIGAIRSPTTARTGIRWSACAHRSPG